MQYHFISHTIINDINLQNSTLCVCVCVCECARAREHVRVCLCAFQNDSLELERAQIRSRSIPIIRVRSPWLKVRLKGHATRSWSVALTLKVRYYKLQSISWSHVLFLGHNLVEIFSHHCFHGSLLKITNGNPGARRSLFYETFQAPGRRRCLAQRTSSSICAGATQLYDLPALVRTFIANDNQFLKGWLQQWAKSHNVVKESEENEL